MCSISYEKMVRGNPELLDDGGEIPKSQGRGCWWFASRPRISSLFDINLPGGQLPLVLWHWTFSLQNKNKKPVVTSTVIEVSSPLTPPPCATKFAVPCWLNLRAFNQPEVLSREEPPSVRLVAGIESNRINSNGALNSACNICEKKEKKTKPSPGRLWGSIPSSYMTT